MNSDSQHPLWKQAFGRLPWSAELAQRWLFSGHHPSSGYHLDRLAAVLPGWVAAAQRAAATAQPRQKRKLLVMGYLRWWVEYTAALAAWLAALGHEVHLATTPYRDWTSPVADFDRRRQALYLRRQMAPLQGLVHLHDLSRSGGPSLPPALAESIEALSRRDVQYALQREALDPSPQSEDGRLYRLRLRRNRLAARRALGLLEGAGFDALVIPNGSIFEFGALYRVARHLNLRLTTFEFGEQRQRLWLAQDDEVMRQDTRALWAARGDEPLTDAERLALETLQQARQGGRLWENFKRPWQAAASQGAQAARQALGLDPQRPLALLCTNVVGDSLALDRQVFTRGMSDWLDATVRHFANRPEAQLVVRVHPGELLGAGHPSVEIVRAALPEMPPHVLVVPPESRINTYDLIELAQFGLTYTTTVGLEMAMSGVPVIVAGETHYRGKGFTHDPEGLEAYYETIDRLLQQPQAARLSERQVDLAWRYAARFFFEYPFPFPWHLIDFWDDVRAAPPEQVYRDPDGGPYAATLAALSGEAFMWEEKQHAAEVERLVS